MKRFKLIAAMSLFIGLLLLVVGGNQQALAAPTTANANIWMVTVGAEAVMQQTDHGPAGAWQFSKFYPNNLTINAGDTIIFKFNTAMEHNVLFLPPGQKYQPYFIPESATSKRRIANPLDYYPTGGATFDGTTPAGSGILSSMSGMGEAGAKEYELTFTKEGSYNFICGPHSALSPAGDPVGGMIGKLTVQAAGSALPKTPAQVASESASAVQADVQSALASNAAATKVTTRPGPTNNTIYTLNVGYSIPTGGEMMRFGAADLQIKVGDTVEWVQHSLNVPHTISFFSGGQETASILTEQQSGGAPAKIVANPASQAPLGSGNVYSGKGVFSSGFLTGTRSQTGAHSYTLTFDTAGRYEYLCIPHDEMGMSAYITVGDPVNIPSTGAGGAARQSGPNWSLILALLIGFEATMGSLIRFLHKQNQAA